MANSADPDLDLHCLQNRVHPGSAGQGLKQKHVGAYKRCLSEAHLMNTTTYVFVEKQE